MTVREVVALLKAYPDHAEVYFRSRNNDYDWTVPIDAAEFEPESEWIGLSSAPKVFLK